MCCLSCFVVFGSVFFLFVVFHSALVCFLTFFLSLFPCSYLTFFFSSFLSLFFFVSFFLPLLLSYFLRSCLPFLLLVLVSLFSGGFLAYCFLLRSVVFRIWFVVLFLCLVRLINVFSSCLSFGPPLQVFGAVTRLAA